MAATSAVTDARTAAPTRLPRRSTEAPVRSAPIGNSATAASERWGKAPADRHRSVTRTRATAATKRSTAAASATTIGQTTAAATGVDRRRAPAEALGDDAERTLLGMSADVARNIVGRADDIHAAVSQRVGEMTRTLDEKSHELLASLSGKGEQFASEVTRVTDQAVKAIEAKGFVFTQSMMDNSEEIARLINDASQTATSAVTRTLGQFQEGTHGVVDAAKANIARTLEDLHGRPEPRSTSRRRPPLRPSPT